jgi:UPF0755 protein
MAGERPPVDTSGREPPALGAGDRGGPVGGRLRPSGARPLSPAEALNPTRPPVRRRPPRPRREPRRLGRTLRMVNAVLTMTFVGFLAVTAALVYFDREVDRAGPLSATTTFVVPRGEGSIEVANRLEREGIVHSALAFKLLSAFERAGSFFGGGPRGGDIKAGEYELRKGASARQVMAALAEGRTVLQRVTIPEGLTSRQIVARLEADPNLTGTIAGVPPEGALLPDTYRFSRGTQRQELIDRMQAEMRKVLAAAWQARRPEVPLESPEEALILASIVEKETGRADERAKVAGVFVNRLRKGMRLQSDPTIIYGIAGGAGGLGRPISRSDIRQATPYNTYQIDGLPPTPICNPGRATIQATLAPEATDALYFVADGKGGHAFAATLKDHNANVANWRRIEKEIRARQQVEAASRAAAVPRTPTTGRSASGTETAVPLGANGATTPSFVSSGTGVAEALTEEGGDEAPSAGSQGGATTAAATGPAAAATAAAGAAAAVTVVNRSAAPRKAARVPLPVRKPRR